ncbi:MAG: YbhB/YbcL family Raf kinase inhibitor-like protein [Acidimicrobiia bacterium]|nr:YbhB/YbcL family Raf kinase inhibitor-like protein [Acidimicrobiia bacterium]
MEIYSNSVTDGERAKDSLALAVPATDNHVTFSANRNPHLAWSGAPDETQSFVVTCIDVDCPSAPDDVNQEDREVPASLPRVDFVHWLLADIPAETTEIAEGSHSDGVTPRGKPADAAPIGIHGVNSYTDWFAGDTDLDGTWHGYDGPAPPWNDSIPHRYVFTVHAMDVASLGLVEGFSYDDLQAAMEGHVLDSASLTMTYTVNPRLR